MCTAVIVNPRSANGRTARDWPRIAPLIERACAPERILHTEHAGHATRLTRELLESGFTQIVSVGGDGTHHEIINGFFPSDGVQFPGTRMAIVPQGTGSDLARSLHLKSVKDAVEAITEGVVRVVDVGRATFTAHDGTPRTEYFLNCAHVGFGGYVADRVNHTSKALGGFMSFLIGVVRGLATYSSPTMTVQIDGTCINGRINDVIIANAQWDGGGMFVAPEAALDSGAFEVYVIDDIGVVDALRNLRKIYQGRLMDRPDIVQHFRASRIEAYSPERVLINLEGEQPGVLPATFDILPGVLNLVTGSSCAIRARLQE